MNEWFATPKRAVGINQRASTQTLCQSHPEPRLVLPSIRCLLGMIEPLANEKHVGVSHATPQQPESFKFECWSMYEVLTVSSERNITMGVISAREPRNCYRQCSTSTGVVAEKAVLGDLQVRSNLKDQLYVNIEHPSPSWT